jgi:hypothetical protein
LILAARKALQLIVPTAKRSLGFSVNGMIPARGADEMSGAAVFSTAGRHGLIWIKGLAG